jgi:hypothetical protein
MLRLTQAPNVAIATLWVDMLREAGMPRRCSATFWARCAGDLPPDQCLPEVWLTHDEQEPQARALLRELQHRPQRRYFSRTGSMSTVWAPSPSISTPSCTVACSCMLRWASAPAPATPRWERARRSGSAAA